MNALNEISLWFAKLGSDSEQLKVLFVVLLGMVGFSLTLALFLFANAILNPLKKRIDDLKHEASGNSSIGKSSDLLHRIGSIFVPKAEKKRSNVFYQLEIAGYRSPQSLAYFYGTKLLGFILFPILVISGVALFTRYPVLNVLNTALFMGVIGFLAPNYWLKIAVRKRQDKLRKALPDALDLMVVCSEAGLGLSAAIKRVADDIGMQHPELADELQLLLMQTRAGMDNRAALKELERRTNLEDISAFVTTLIQAMRFGTSIGQSLRVFAEEMRDKRLQRAQEKAARLNLTMLMPIAFCMLPMFFLIMLGPALLSLINALGKFASG
jgi:tight adherence protein C